MSKEKGIKMRKVFIGVTLMVFLVVGWIFFESMNSEIVEFDDMTFEQCVRENLKKMKGDITSRDMESIISIDCDYDKIDSSSNTIFPKIRNIKGGEKMKNVVEVNFSNNEIEDILPLSGLVKIKTLILSKNKIESIASLKKLTEIEKFSAEQNKIKEVSVLSNFQNLKNLKIFGNLMSIDEFEKMLLMKNLANLEKSDKTENTNVLGALDRSVIDGVIRKNLKPIVSCYENELEKYKSLAGRIVIHFVIAKDGSVIRSSVHESTMNNSFVESCIVKVMKTLKYPAPKGDGVVIVNYPFVFKS